jgi:hypothetical protein
MHIQKADGRAFVNGGVYSEAGYVQSLGSEKTFAIVDERFTIAY